MYSVDEAHEILVWKDSYQRLQTLISLHSKMDRVDWLMVLGELITGSDDLWEFHKELKERLGTKGPINELMDDDERSIYMGLPDVVTVYRGCGPHNRKGMSWSLDRAVAEKFPFLNRYAVASPGLITGRVKKNRILAYKNDRNEQEILSFSVKEVQMDFILTNPLTKELLPKPSMKPSATP